MPVTRWFGSACKFSYLGIGNTKLNLTPQYLINGIYGYQKPDVLLPTIVNGNLQAIKDYFRDETFIK